MKIYSLLYAAVEGHLSNIFAAGRLEEQAVISILETTAADGKSIIILV